MQAREVYQADMPTSRQTGGSGVCNEEEDKNMMASDVNFEGFKSIGTECFEEADADPGSGFLAAEPDGELPYSKELRQMLTCSLPPMFELLWLQLC